MNATIKYRLATLAKRGWNRCPACDWRFWIDNDWELNEIFCLRCESRLIATDDDRPQRWIQAGIRG